MEPGSQVGVRAQADVDRHANSRADRQRLNRRSATPRLPRSPPVDGDPPRGRGLHLDVRRLPWPHFDPPAGQAPYLEEVADPAGARREVVEFEGGDAALLVIHLDLGGKGGMDPQPTRGRRGRRALAGPELLAGGLVDLDPRASRCTGAGDLQPGHAAGNRSGDRRRWRGVRLGLGPDGRWQGGQRDDEEDGKNAHGGSSFADRGR